MPDSKNTFDEDYYDGDEPVYRRGPPDTELFVSEVLDSEEWDSLDEAERAQEDPNDLIAIDVRAVSRLLGEGKGVLK